MESIFQSPGKSFGVGIVLAGLMTGLYVVLGGALDAEFLRFLTRAVHVLAAIIFIGLAWFVNFIMLPANYEQDDAGKKVIGKSFAPRAAWWLRHSSTLTVLAGLLLAAQNGYFMDVMTMGAWNDFAVPKHILLGLGIWIAIAMWGFVHMFIWPNMQVMLGMREGDMDAKGRARIKVRNFARINLMLAIPVIFIMVAAQNIF